MSGSDEEQKPRASLETDSPTRGEPEGLATRGVPTGRNSEVDVKEMRGLAKQWDAQDKAAKDKAKPKLGMRRSLVEHVPAPVEVTSPHQSQPLRRSPSQEKLRATYLQTGMKPGAYPGRGPEGSGIEELEQRLISRQYDTRLSSDNLDPDNKTTDPDIAVEPEPEPPKDEPDIDLEQGHSEIQHEGPLIEAFVVPDEDAERSFMPPVKAGTAGPPLIEGDHYEKPKPARDESSSGLGLSKHALLLVASLVGCFLIGAVLVVVVVLLVVSPGGGGSDNDVFSNSATGGAPTPTGTLVPTAAPILPEMTMPTVIDLSPGDIPTQEPFLTPPVDPEQAPETKTPSFQPSKAPSYTPTVEPLPSAEPSMGPTVPAGTPTDPPSAEPTMAPTTSPTKAPTVRPTTSPPTPRPTEPPTPRPTEPPTPRPTEPPTPRPTEPPTPRPTNPPTREPTIAPTEAVAVTPAPQSATLPPLNLQTTARVVFEADYTINRSNLDPSQEEIDTLDALLEADFAAALASQVSYQEDVLLKSQHEATDTGWKQTIWVDFVFGEGNLPPIGTIQSGLSSFSVSAFVSKAKSVGPSFAGITRMAWGLRVPEYASV